MTILFLVNEAAPKAFSESFRLAAAVAGFTSMVCKNVEEFQSRSRALTANEEVHFLVSFLDGRGAVRELLAEKGFVRSVASILEKEASDLEKKDLQTGFARHVLPAFGGVDAAATMMREHLIATFSRWRVPQLCRLESELFLAECQRVKVQNKAQKDALIPSIESHLGSFSPLAFPRYASTFVPRCLEVTEELLFNALSASGVNPDGVFELPREKAVSVEFGFNGGTFGVSVTDAIGGLRPWTFFQKALGDSADSPSAQSMRGASLGIGLRMTLKLSRDLTAQVAQGRFSCVTSQIPYERSGIEAASLPKRMEFFAL